MSAELYYCGQAANIRIRLKDGKRPGHYKNIRLSDGILRVGITQQDESRVDKLINDTLEQIQKLLDELNVEADMSYFWSDTNYTFHTLSATGESDRYFVVDLSNVRNKGVGKYSCTIL